jgi:hypothetical protein|tara:strand:+ start:1583 stop:2305 length:723 start_codon:yes stop_codon:yes gene_type:complete
MAEEQVQETQQESQESNKPEYISDKFWDNDRGEVNVESLGTSYNSLEKKLGQRTDELTKQIRTDIEQERNAKVPEKYEVVLPEDMPENISMEINEEQPLLQWWSEKARSLGLSQEQYNEGISQFVNNEIAGLPDSFQEEQKLGDNAKDRIESADLWSKKHLSEEGYNAVSKLAETAEGIKALEEIMSLNKNSVMPQSPTAVDTKPNLADLRNMMKDPRYWKDGEKDPVYIERISKLFEQV